MIEEKVIFYSTHCPRCKALEMLLKQKNVKYTEVNDIDEMKANGLETAPGLKVGDHVMNFAEAMKYIRENIN